MSLAFLRSRRLRVITVLLSCQILALYALSRPETEPPYIPLTQFPDQVADWELVQESAIDANQKSILLPDDSLVRTYRHGSTNTPASLFVAYFRSQTTGRMPHSPRNCLPGSGWTASGYELAEVPVPGSQPITVNRYVVEKGGEKVLVLYWYQTSTRVVAKELSARFYLAADSIRLNRSDTALVRIMTSGLEDGSYPDSLTREFASKVYTGLRSHIQ